MATVNVVAKFYALAFLLRFFPPRVEVDGGAAQKIKWGSNPLQLAPGQHQIEVYFPYLFISKAGKASIEVNLAEGDNKTVTYQAPWLVFFGGKIAVA